MSRPWWLFVILLLLVQAAAIAVVNIEHLNRKSFVELQQAQRERDNLMIEFGQLQLEQGAWGAHGRVEQLAHEKLSMQMPQFAAVKTIIVPTGVANESR